MFEIPEYRTLARQLRESVAGRRIREGSLGNSPHKFVWYNRSHDEFASLTRAKVAGQAYTRGRCLFLPLEPGYVLVFGECGGKFLFHRDEATVPSCYHLLLRFEDGAALSTFTQMWGAMELYEKDQELKRQYIADMRPTPTEEEFSLDHFLRLVDQSIGREKRSVKGLLTQDQLIPGLGNAIAQDIMFKARLHPRRLLGELSRSQLARLYEAILETVEEATRQGGRNDEYDLYGQPGGYARIMDRNAAGRPCPKCGTLVVKIQYLGGACYYCPGCQA